MGEWVIGAFINIFGSVAINFGTNLLKLGHNERERLALQDNGGGKMPLKLIIHFQTWRVGILVFLLGNCLNFISFGYAAQVNVQSEVNSVMARLDRHVKDAEVLITSGLLQDNGIVVFRFSISSKKEAIFYLF
ncbi:unnamed protein product [Arabidopsis halleri]